MEDIASRIVDKAVSLGCQDAVADVVENRSYQIRFARNEAVISNQWRESSASVFLVHDRRVVATDIKDLTKADEAVERLVKTAKASQPNPEYAGIAKGPFRYARTRPDPKVLSLDEGGKYVEAAVGGAVDQGAKECAGSFWKYEDEHFLATSNGVEGHDHRASLYLSIRALVSLESSGHGIACATKLSQFTPEKAGQKAGHIASLARAPKSGKAGLVAPDSHAVFVKPGDRSRDEIFSEVKDGLWLTNTWYTRYQSYVNGDLSTIPRDGIFHIRNGEVVGALKDIRLTDNLLHLMKNIVALGDEPEQMMWWGEVSVPNFVPYALIKDVGITKSAE